MKRCLMLVLFALLCAPAFPGVTYLPNGLSLGTVEDTDKANVTPGEDDLYVPGTLEVDKASRFDYDMTISSPVIETSHTQNITVQSTALGVYSKVENLNVNVNVDSMSITAAPTISTQTYTVGTTVRFIVTSTKPVTFNDNDGSFSTLVELGATRRTINQGGFLELRLGTKNSAECRWYETGYCNGTVTETILDATITNSTQTVSKITTAIITTAQTTNETVTNSTATVAKITTAIITQDQVTNQTVTNSTVTVAKITTAIITTAQTTNETVTNSTATVAKIATAIITTDQVTDATVTNSTITVGRITTAIIDMGQVTNETVTNSTTTVGKVATAILSDAQVSKMSSCGDATITNSTQTVAVVTTLIPTNVQAKGYLFLGTKSDAELKLYTPGFAGEMWVSSTDSDLYIATGTTPYGFKKFAIANPD